jgi:hypothetical protein
MFIFGVTVLYFIIRYSVVPVISSLHASKLKRFDFCILSVRFPVFYNHISCFCQVCKSMITGIGMYAFTFEDKDGECITQHWDYAVS